MTKPPEEKLAVEARTNITELDMLALETIAVRRGRRVKVRDVIRDLIDTLIAREFPEGFTPSIAEDAPVYGHRKPPAKAKARKKK